MKCKYKGYEIDVRKERCLGGWTMTYYDVFRDDGRHCIGDFSEGEDSVRDWIKWMKERIDEELASDDPWGEKAEDEMFQ